MRKATGWIIIAIEAKCEISFELIEVKWLRLKTLSIEAIKGLQ